MSSKLYKNYRKSLEQFFSGKQYKPLSEKELLEHLQIPKQNRECVKQVLTDLLLEDFLEVKRRRFHLKTTEPPPLIGILRVHVRGFGFFKPDLGQPVAEEVFIPKHCMAGAVDGDRVEVKLLPPTGIGKGPEGSVETIILRGRELLGATITHFDKQGNIYAYAPLLGAAKPLMINQNNSLPCKQGDRVVLKVEEWGDRTRPPTATIEKMIGSITDASLDVAAAVHEFDLPKEFSKAVMKEVKQWGTTVDPKQYKGRKDLTEETTITIDPETAKDFDDALSIRIDKQGHIHLSVHIADVSAYVKGGSELDIEAQKRSNTTYFPGICIPMLPPALSDGLCSLKPRLVRLTVTVNMEFDPTGDLIRHAIFRSYIKSNKRFTYEEAKEVLDGKHKSPYKKDLDALVTLCNLLKKRRSARGSIDFALPELVVHVDKKGEPTGVHTVEYDITHQLVEECMLKANEVVAKELADRGVTLLFRIHEEPEATSIEEFAELARLLGFHMPQKRPTMEEISALFDKAKKTPHAHRLSVAFIRSMKLAIYSPENVGHYGLALEHYCHFTSPIRRYSDLIIHRLLMKEKFDASHIHQVALQCSEQERLSMRAETHVKRLKKLRLLKKWTDEDPSRSFNAVITQVKPFGLTLEIQELMLEGFLHVSELENDYFDYNPTSNQLHGRDTGIIHKVSDTLSVIPEHIDLIELEVKWSPLQTQSRKRRPHGKRRRRK